MIAFEGLNDNLQFIILETSSQIEAILDYIKNPLRQKHKQIIDRDDYVDNLKAVIENLCFGQMASSSVKKSKSDTDALRAVHIIAVNLERIADNCISILKQTDYLRDIDFLYQFNYEEILHRLRNGIQMIPGVFQKRRLNDALDICKIEDEIDIHYKNNFELILQKLEEGGSSRNLVTVLFIYMYLERMGDSLLNIGEALIIGIVGEKIRISQIQLLAQSLDKQGAEEDLSGMAFRSFWGTRSGCRISQVTIRDSEEKNEYRNSIFKEGSIAKIAREKENLETWHRLFPDVAPRLYSSRTQEDTASLLMEYIEGNTLDEIILSADANLLPTVFRAFTDLCNSIWTSTKRDTPIPTDYVAQIKNRIAGVRDVHPDFFRSELLLGDVRIQSSNALIDICEKAESSLTAPFTVRIHGDFNVSNIMFVPQEERIRFIDMYRSKDGDYIQDASVFLVSNFRLPVLDVPIRKKLNWVIESFFNFVKDFAKRQADDTFEFRMTLALARSLYTSTRFELNNLLAKEMYLRAHYLLDKLAAFINADNDIRSFNTPESVLYY